MKRLNLLFVYVIIAAPLLSGCTSGSTPSSTDSSQTDYTPTEKHPTEISVVTSYSGDDGNRMNYENAFKAYEASTGNTVKDLSSTSNEEWKASVLASFDVGDEPDVLFFFTGTDSNKIIKEGKVVSIDEIRGSYPDYASNMKEDMLAKSPVDGKNYAVPVNGYWEGMYVNKKVLAECGVAIPDANTTWSQFMDDCKIIADHGYIPIAASLYEVPHYWFEFCVFNNGTAESHPKQPDSSSDDFGVNWVAGIDDIKDIYERGFLPENTTSATDAETNALMTANKAAFMIDGSWKMGWFAENAANIDDFTVTYIPGKNQRKATDIVGGLSMGYYITKKAWENPEKRDACVAFVEAMTTNEVVSTFGITAITALKSDITPPSDASNIVKDALAMINNCTEIVPAAGDGLTTESRRDLFGNIKNVVDGSMTAQEAIDHCLGI